MAHPEDLQKLRQGPKAWNKWRRQNPDYIPDFRDAELAMNERHFGPGNGGPIDLSDADLRGMVLRNSTLTAASLVRANLVAADLVQARLEGANLSGADLTDAVLDYADLTGANLNSTILTGASLVNVTGLTQAQIEQAHGDASTALPAYLLPPESWFPMLDGDLFKEYDSNIDLSPLTNDPYEILGVDRNATFEEIRTAFRTLVKRLHPDLNPNDNGAQERFKRVSIAYRILGDPVKRDRYNSGEIDANGDVRPDYEAKQEFQRYALKFYIAAAASLLLAVGILTAVWYTFWVQGVSDGNEGFQTANRFPPKQSERLIAHKPFRSTAPSESQEPAVPPSQIAAITNAVQAGDSFETTANAPEVSSTTKTEAEITAPAANAAHITGPGTTKDLNKRAPTQLDDKTSQDGPITSQTDADTALEKQLARLVANGALAISKTEKTKNEDNRSLAEATLPETTFKPVWSASVHRMIYHKQPGGPGIVKDAVLMAFRNRIKRRGQQLIKERTAQSVDSLQVRRRVRLKRGLVGFAVNLSDFDKRNDGLPELPITQNATSQILSNPLFGEQLDDTAAFDVNDTKTAKHFIDSVDVPSNRY